MIELIAVGVPGRWAAALRIWRRFVGRAGNVHRLFKVSTAPKNSIGDPRQKGRMSDLSVLALGADTIANRGNPEPILEQPAEM